MGGIRFSLLAFLWATGPFTACRRTLQGLCLTAFFAAAAGLSAQSRVDTALVQMARAEVAFYDIPQVENLARPGIVRSRYNTVYPVSWQLRDATLTDGMASLQLFVVRLQGREQKSQSLDTFYDRSAHRGIAQGYGAQYLQSVYFRTAAGRDALRIDMFRQMPSGGEYLCVYFVRLGSAAMLSATGRIPVRQPAPRDDTSWGDPADKYRVLFDATVKNIDRR